MERVVFGTFWSREKKSTKLAGTSRCPNVAMSQRRDVSANSVSTSLKAKGTRNQGGSEKHTNEGMESREQRTRSMEKTLDFVFSSFLKDC